MWLWMKYGEGEDHPNMEPFVRKNNTMVLVGGVVLLGLIFAAIALL